MEVPSESDVYTSTPPHVHTFARPHVFVLDAPTYRPIDFSPLIETG
jgi:hypothetical protein